ncbi:hypothetical protein ADIARSV_1514 [Arcticibacter svalbardensis MN12-7]|uniref:Uncharacterized protein n=1 Tax=Arcticibacter svalbardensis MN12-7 TaxID=1150600 RepID=R9H282_9SPHI|nr:hypothetical protein [Arcticibacter svalbardensis]EOR95319.1 hypothetical protein ADIARSV_1514 [Arcticibacter svalbardensis MN12-7]
MKWCVLFLLNLILFCSLACKKNITNTLNLPDFSKIKDKEIIVSKLILLGKYEDLRIQTETLKDSNYLNQFGLKENSIYADDLSNVKNIKEQLALNDLFDIEKSYPLKDTTPTATYAFCEVYSPVVQKAALRFSSQGKLILWFNGEKIFDKVNNHYLQKDQNIISVNLKKEKIFF